ncbi:MAG TPA: beta-propeller fold lactonase family protein [Gemmatimonadales bacterium]|nr:beta-propeller fold lactonase family protein [Gemmatimonadales bacterium]
MNLLFALLCPVFVYVANQASGKVTVIDAATDAVVAVVDFSTMGFSANPKPHHIVVEPDGSYWYVSLIGDNAVVKLDRANRVVAKAETVTPGLLAIDPTSDLLYATRSMSAVNAPARIAVINRKTMTPEEVEVLVSRPHGLAIAPDGKHAYVASLGTNQIAVYDASREQVGIVDVPGGDTSQVIVQLAVSPDGRTLVATSQLTGKLLVFDLADAARPKLVQRVTTGDWPWLVTFTPDGAEVWVPNQRSNDVTVVDAKHWSVITTVKGDFAQPDGIAISGDGRLVFVANHNTSHVMTMGGISMAMPMPGMTAAPGRVIVIDARRRAVVKRIDTAPDGAGLGLGGKP